MEALRSALSPSLVAAAGIGLTLVPVTVTAIAGIEPGQAGVASGLVNTSQQVGAALGLAVLASLAETRTDTYHPATTHRGVGGCSVSPRHGCGPGLA